MGFKGDYETRGCQLQLEVKISISCECNLRMPGHYQQCCISLKYADGEVVVAEFGPSDDCELVQQMLARDETEVRIVVVGGKRKSVKALVVEAGLEDLQLHWEDNEGYRSVQARSSSYVQCSISQ
jgi:hypothetical protein